MWTQFVAWLKSKNVNSHVVVGVIIAVATALVTDTQVRDFFVSTFQAHPKIVATVISIAGIIFKYSTSRTDTAIIKDAAAVAPINPDPNRPISPTP